MDSITFVFIYVFFILFNLLINLFNYHTQKRNIILGIVIFNNLLFLLRILFNYDIICIVRVNFRLMGLFKHHAILPIRKMVGLESFSIK